MTIIVDDNIIKGTTKCKKNFSCLSGETTLCGVELCIENKIHFIKFEYLSLYPVPCAALQHPQ